MNEMSLSSSVSSTTEECELHLWYVGLAALDGVVFFIAIYRLALLFIRSTASERHLPKKIFFSLLSSSTLIDCIWHVANVFPVVFDIRLGSKGTLWVLTRCISMIADLLALICYLSLALFWSRLLQLLRGQQQKQQQQQQGLESKPTSNNNFSILKGGGCTAAINATCLVLIIPCFLVYVALMVALHESLRQDLEISMSIGISSVYLLCAFTLLFLGITISLNMRDRIPNASRWRMLIPLMSTPCSLLLVCRGVWEIAHRAIPSLHYLQQGWIPFIISLFTESVPALLLIVLMWPINTSNNGSALTLSSATEENVQNTFIQASKPLLSSSRANTRNTIIP